MRWEVDMEEIEAVLEKIWDLHDKVSDAIHSISRAHFLKSIKTLGRPPPAGKRFHSVGGGGREDGRGGFVFVKGFRAAEAEGEEEDDDGVAIAEARSLHGIRTALENLEDQLEFFHTVQSQQRVERDAAIARLEQSRIILAMRLADHHGKKFKVIEEALSFVGNMHDAGRFIAPGNLFEKARSQCGDNSEVNNCKSSNALLQMLISGLALAKKSLRLDRLGGALGNAAIFAVSMLAIFHLHQATFKSNFLLEAPPMQGQASLRKRVQNSDSRFGSFSQNNEANHLDVLSARG